MAIFLDRNGTLIGEAETALEFVNEFGAQTDKWCPDYLASDILQATNWYPERISERSAL